jgi:UDP-3-O-[3-hydroxymyristoyl] glucosamine N-acyltransferase
MADTLQTLADFLSEQGLPCSLVGHADLQIESVATLEEAGPGQIAFVANPRYAKQLVTTRASAVVVDTKVQAPERLSLLRTEDPYAAVTALIVRLHGHRRHPRWGIHPQACIHPSARLGADANVAPYVVIGEDVTIGDRATIYPGCYVADRCRIGHDLLLMPGVTVYDDTQMGDHVTIHAGTVIGEDGLGYAPVGETWVKIPQAGRVIIGDNVEIGSNCTVDRATLGATVIDSGTKFSNLIAIGHGSKVGRNCMFVAQVGLAGSVNVGEHVTMAGQVGVAGHLKIGDHAQVAAKAGVTSDVPPNTRVLGQPAMPMAQAKRAYATFTRLPDLKERIKALEEQQRQLAAQLEELKALSHDQS